MKTQHSLNKYMKLFKINIFVIYFIVNSICGYNSLTFNTISIFSHVKSEKNRFNINHNCTEQYFQDILSNKKMQLWLTEATNNEKRKKNMGNYKFTNF